MVFLTWDEFLKISKSYFILATSLNYPSELYLNEIYYKGLYLNTPK